MAGKRIKFALKMKDGVEVRTLQELKESFDLNQVVSYYLDGKLEAWLLDRYYKDLAEKIEELDKSFPELGRRLCEIFEVEYQEDSISTEKIEAIKERNQRINRLKELTNDEEIIEMVDYIAFTQKELNNLLDNGEGLIYLCGADFHIPMSEEWTTYIGIGTKLDITYEELKQYRFKNIKFINLLDEKMELMNIQVTLEKILEKGLEIYLRPYSLLNVPDVGSMHYINQNCHSELEARKEGESRLLKAYNATKHYLNRYEEENYAFQVADQLFEQIKDIAIEITAILNNLSEKIKMKNESILYLLNKELELDQLHYRVKNIAEEVLDVCLCQLGDFSFYAKDITIDCLPNYDLAYHIVSDYYISDAARPFECLNSKLWSYLPAVTERYKKDIILSIHELILKINI